MRLIRRILVLMIILAASLSTLVYSCTGNQNDGLAIYLTRGEIPPERMPFLNQVDIAEKPVISIDDIVSYDPAIYLFTFTAGAYERIYKLPVPVGGSTFLVCINKQPVYWGAFWTQVSSLHFPGVTIWKPLKYEEPYELKLELSSTSALYHNVDPRNNPEILQELEKADNLVSSDTATPAGRQP